MSWYSKIKREHLAIFLVFLFALIIFDYFDVGYTGLTIRQDENCLAYGGSCCDIGTGARYLSLDDSCGGKECWAECVSDSKVRTGMESITGESVFDWFNENVISVVEDSVNKLFKREIVGAPLVGACNDYDKDEGWRDYDGEIWDLVYSDTTRYRTSYVHGMFKKIKEFEFPEELFIDGSSCYIHMLLQGYAAKDSLGDGPENIYTRLKIEGVTGPLDQRSGENPKKAYVDENGWVYGRSETTDGASVGGRGYNVPTSEIKDDGEIIGTKDDGMITIGVYAKGSSDSFGDDWFYLEAFHLWRSKVIAGECGDGNLDSGEECDGSNFGGANCYSETGLKNSADQTFGSLNCDENCEIDSSGCFAEARCKSGYGTPISETIVIDPREGSHLENTWYGVNMHGQSNLGLQYYIWPHRDNNYGGEVPNGILLKRFIISPDEEFNVGIGCEFKLKLKLFSIFSDGGGDHPRVTRYSVYVKDAETNALIHEEIGLLTESGTNYGEIELSTSGWPKRDLVVEVRNHYGEFQGQSLRFERMEYSWKESDPAFVDDPDEIPDEPDEPEEESLCGDSDGGLQGGTKTYLDEGEDCDCGLDGVCEAWELGNTDCNDHGYNKPGVRPACYAPDTENECTFDFTPCEGSGEDPGDDVGECGNGILEGNEECDGSAMLYTNCVDYNSAVFSGGSLSCRTPGDDGTDRSCLFDTSGCEYKTGSDVHYECNCDIGACVQIQGAGDDECNPNPNHPDNFDDACDCEEGGPVCGDGTCEDGEDETSCPEDCFECEEGYEWVKDNCYVPCIDVALEAGYDGGECRASPRDIGTDDSDTYHLGVYSEVNEGSDYCNAKSPGKKCWGMLCDDGYYVYRLKDNGIPVCRVIEESSVPTPTGFNGNYLEDDVIVELSWNKGNIDLITGSVVYGFNPFRGITGLATRDNEGFFGGIWNWIIRLFGGSIVAERPSPDVEAECDVTGDGFCVYVDRGDGNEIVYLGKVLEIDADSPGIVSFTHEVSAERDVNDKTYTYYVQAVDDDERSELASKEITIRGASSDNVDPVLEVVSVSDASGEISISGGKYNTELTEIVVKVSATDNVGVSSVGGFSNRGSFSCTRPDPINAEDIYECVVLVENDNTGVTAEIEQDADITAVDNVGNEKNLEIEVVWNRPDLAGPSISLNAPSNGLGISSENYVEVSADISFNYLPDVVSVLNTESGYSVEMISDSEWLNEGDTLEYHTIEEYGESVIPHLKLDCSADGVENNLEITALDMAGKEPDVENVMVVCSFREDDLTAPVVEIIGGDTRTNEQFMDIGVEIIDDEFETDDTYSAEVWVIDNTNTEVYRATDVFMHGANNVFEEVELYDGGSYEGVSVVRVEVVDDNAGAGVADSLKTSRTELSIEIDSVRPVTELYLEGHGAEYSGNEFEEGVEITLIGDDDGDYEHDSDVTIYYKLDNENEFSAHIGEDALVFSVENNGAHTLKYYSVDGAGNTENEQTESFIITDANMRPNVDFPSHSYGDIEYEGVGFAVTARVVDTDNGENVIKGRWYVNDVQLGNEEEKTTDVGESVSFELVASENRNFMTEAGVYVLRFEAEDYKESIGESEIVIEIVDREKVSCSIKSPINGDFLEVGKNVNIIGIADDRGDQSGGEIESYEWVIDGLDVEHGDVTSGNDYFENTLEYVFEETGSHVIEFSVEDNDGDLVEDSITVYVNDINSPEPTIITPVDNQDYVIGGDSSLIIFEGTGSDVASDGVSEGEIVSWSWTLLRNAGQENEERVPIGTGQRIERIAGLEVGEGYYDIELTAVDADGNAGRAVSENIHVKSRHAPTVIITSPVNEEVFHTEENIGFRGEAEDPDNDNIAVWRWTSSQDGVLNDAGKWDADDYSVVDNGGSKGWTYGFNLRAGALSLGRHKIKVLVIDDSEKAYEDTYIIYITIDPSFAPNVNILGPVVTGGTAYFEQGEAIHLVGEVFDPNEEGICNYEWSSDLVTNPLRIISDEGCGLGGVGNDVEFITSSLLPGNHLVTLRAWDIEGLSSHASINVVVREVPLRITKPLSSRVELVEGDEQEFSAVGGNGQASYVWRIEGDNCGRFVGSGSVEEYGKGDVLFSAEEIGECDVIVSSGTQSVSTEVEVLEKILPDINAPDVERYNHPTYGYVMRLSWVDTSIAGASKYVIEYKESADWLEVAGSGSIGKGVEELYHYGSSSCIAGTNCLADGVTYRYRMKAVDEGGEDVTKWSPEVSLRMDYGAFVEDCDTPLIDSDNDGVIAGLDVDCCEGADCTNLYGVDIEDEIKTSKSDNKTYVGTDITVDCYYDVIDSSGDSVNEDVYYTSAIDCISVFVGENEYISGSKVSNGRARFSGCEVGDEVGIIDIRCIADADRCNVYGLGISSTEIQVIDFEYCEDGVVGGDLVINDYDTDSSEYKQEEEIEIIVDVENININEDDMDVVVEAKLYNIDEEEDVEEAEESMEIEFGEEEEFVLNITVPDDAETSDDYVLLIKAYEEGKEDDNCLQEKVYLDIRSKTTCDDDDDDDGYVSEDCGGEDCDDDDSTINPGETEICTDGDDNDCDGDVDEEDSDCQECDDGEQEVCGSSVGACVPGTRTCYDGIWGDCMGSVDPEYEDCNDGIDNDCDGLADCDDIECYDICGIEGGEDIDGDELPDSWELTYWSSLGAYGPDDDPDGDGFTNYEEWLNGTDPTVADKGKSNIWIVLLVVVLVLGAVGAGLYFFVLKKGMRGGKKKPVMTTVKASGGVNPQLKAYVQKAVKKGFKRAQIERVLIAKGWRKKDIDAAFKK